METQHRYADGTMAFINTADGVKDLHIGGPATPTVLAPRRSSVVRAKMPLAALDTAGGVLAWVNPEDAAILVSRVVVDVTTKSTAACTLDIGVAADGTTSNDSLLDGLDVGTATGTFDNFIDKGTNGKAVKKVAQGSYVTASKASGAAAGLVGFAYIDYTRV